MIKRLLWVISISIFVVMVFSFSPNIIGHTMWNLSMHQFLIFTMGAENPPSLPRLVAARNLLPKKEQQGLSALASARVSQIHRLVDRYSISSFDTDQKLDEFLALAVDAENLGDNETAIKVYETIIHELDSHYIPAYYRLYSLYDVTGRTEDAAHIASQLTSLKPEYIIAVSKEIGEISPVGYQLNELSLETLRPIPITIYWESPAPVCEADVISYWHSQDGDVYCVRDKIFQITNLTNLGGVGEDIRFLWASGMLGYRSGFSDDNINDLHGLTYIERDDLPTVAFMLHNSQSTKNILISPNIEIEVKSTDYYLLSSWIKADNGKPNAGIGVICFGEKYTDEQRYYIPFRGEAVQEWTYFASVIQVSDTDRVCRVLLMNYGDPNTVYFDDIIFAPLSIPTRWAQ